MQVHGKSVPLIRQMGTTDCGIACLTMLFQYYGFNIDISELRLDEMVYHWQKCEILQKNMVFLSKPIVII